jgi:hypothetical protein
MGYLPQGAFVVDIIPKYHHAGGKVTSQLIPLTIKAKQSAIKYSDGKGMPVVPMSGVRLLNYEYRSLLFCN